MSKFHVTVYSYFWRDICLLSQKVMLFERIIYTIVIFLKGKGNKTKERAKGIIDQ
jgi:hypothetical protein